MMSKVDLFLDQLKNYDKENVQPEAVKAVQYYLDKPGFDPETIKTKSSAAAGIYKCREKLRYSDCRKIAYFPSADFWDLQKTKLLLDLYSF